MAFKSMNVPRIFISYARADGAELAKNIRERLTRYGLTIWHDIEDIQGGDKFWNEITEAIDNIEYVVLVLTPGALRSNVVQEEWRYARQKGKCVIPLIGSPQLDFSSLQGWMQRTHFVDPNKKEQWRLFVNQLHTRCNVSPRPRMIEELPANYIDRITVREEIIQKLIDQATHEPRPVKLVIVGAPGIGKTTVARAVCHDTHIQEAFDDGILWVKLGKDPAEIRAHLNDLITILTGRHTEYATLEAALAKFTETLGERRTLIVIDDAWNAAHLHPFLQGGRNSARIITTRNIDVIPLNAEEIAVGPMEVEEATRLLHANPPPESKEELSLLAKRLGHWPILLNLVGRTLAKRTHRQSSVLADAIRDINDILATKGVTAFDKRGPLTPDQAVAATVELSLKEFEDLDRQRFYQLSAFPDDVHIPIKLLARLWKIPAEDARKLGELCEQHSLISRIDRASDTISLHNVLREYLRHASPGKDVIHRNIIESYGSIERGGWHETENDGYFYDWISYHFIRSGLHHDFRSIIFSWNWIIKKVELGLFDSLIRDFRALSFYPECSVFASALELCRNEITEAPEQAGAQIMARVSPSDGDNIRNLLLEIRECSTRPCLLPQRATLPQPGTGLLKIMRGHSSSISVIKFCADEKSFISGGLDSNIFLWDIEKGAVKLSLTGHCGPVLSIHVSKDAKRALSSSMDLSIILWNLETAEPIRKIRLETGYASAAWILNENEIAYLEQSIGIYGLSLETGERNLILDGRADAISTAAFDSDFSRLAYSTLDHRIKVWDRRSGETTILSGHEATINSIAFGAQGSKIISGSDDWTVRIWDLENRKIVFRLATHTGPIASVAYANFTDVAASGSWDNNINLWNAKTGKLHGVLYGHSRTVEAVDVSSNGQNFISGALDATIRLWSAPKQSSGTEKPMHEDWVRAIALLPGEDHVLSGSDDHTISLWDRRTGLASFRQSAHAGWVTSLAICSEGHQAISTSTDCTAKLWNLLDLQHVHTFVTAGQKLFTSAVTADGRIFLAGSSKGSLFVWEIPTRRMLNELVVSNRAITSLTLTQQELLLIGLQDGRIQLWDWRRGVLLKAFGGHHEEITCVLTVPDGDHFVSTSRDKSIRLWNFSTGLQVSSFEPHRASIAGAAVFKDGTNIVSTSEDETVVVSELSSGRKLAQFRGDGILSACVAMSDNSTIFVGDSAGRVHILDYLT